MNTVVVRRFARLTRELGKAIMLRWEGPFKTDDYVRLVVEDLGKYDLNHVDFRADLARTFVRADLAERSNVDPFKVTARGALDVQLFKPTDFAKGIIRLGDRSNVRMIHATSRHWVARQLHQQRAAEDSQRAATRTTMFLQTEPGVMLIENPRLKTQDAMCQLSLWTPDEVREAEDDNEDEDEL